MLGPYDLPPAYYEKKQRGQVFEWDYPRPASLRAPITLERERQEQFIQEAELERRYSRLAPGTSWSGRLFFNIGAGLVKAGCRLSASGGAWLVKVGCHLEGYGFGQLRLRSANVPVGMDCGCS